MRNRSLRNSRRGFSLTELLIVIAIILIIVAAALPRLTRARMFAEETAAIRAVSVIHTAQTQYYSQFGRYATSLTELGPPGSGTAGPAGADLIDRELSTGSKGGYSFALAANTQGYTVNAQPKQFGTNGSRTFFSDQTQIIRNRFASEPATAQDPEVGASDKQAATEKK
ncbi:MAG: prepilin-type N-terminal cleavage/methylation domain-containing protein [Bryobacter sp.]|jgi:type IV pilus assembly protein PilA|nr:prepilin-type N-terminal cleavage/methylation domain-containing protein [Bryobacter sp. CoA8 C33]